MTLARAAHDACSPCSGTAVDIAEPPPGDEDWYANILWLERRKCLPLTDAGTLSSVFLPDVRAPHLRPLGPTIVGVVGAAPSTQRSADARFRDADVRGLLRGGASDDDLRDAITGVWARRADRNSEIRTERTSELPRIEMSHIGG